MAGHKERTSLTPGNRPSVQLSPSTEETVAESPNDQNADLSSEGANKQYGYKRKQRDIPLSELECGGYDGCTSYPIAASCNAPGHSYFVDGSGHPYFLEWDPAESHLSELCAEPAAEGIHMLQYLQPATVARPIYRQRIRSSPLSGLFSMGGKEKEEMDVTTTKATAESPVDAASDLSREAELLQSFCAVPNIDKAWVGFTKPGSKGLNLQVASSQINVRANSKVTFVSSLFIPDTARLDEHHWSPFPVELSGAALVVPSPSGSKLLVVRKAEDVTLEIWGQGQLLYEVAVGSSVHGSVYADGGFEGVSWSKDEELIAYVAEEAAPPRPVFGFRSSTSPQSDAGTWKGQGDWTEDWGETYTGKRRPVLFVVSLRSGTVQVVEGLPSDLSAGQVVWSPVPADGGGQLQQSLVFVGWPSESSNFKTSRKLGLKHCYNRPSSLYEVRAPRFGSHETECDEEVAQAVRLTNELGSAFAPTFSPDGKQLVYLSAQSAVDTGVHCCTTSLCSLQWPVEKDGKAQVRDVVPVVQRAEVPGGFPGLYSVNIVAKPWLDEGSTLRLLLTSSWRSSQAILAVNVDNGEVTRVSPSDSPSSWVLHGVHGNLVIATTSAPNAPAALSLGFGSRNTWTWTKHLSTALVYSSEIKASLASTSFQILEIPVPLAESGAQDPFEAILVRCGKPSAPLILVLHGGPHSVSTTCFSRTAAFLSALGFNLFHVNYRGSLGFGEQALQSLPGKAGKQDVADVIAALDSLRESCLVDTSEVAILGGSHGGFLATHLLGQAPDRFVTAAVRNPVTNISSMVGITDIPDWCYVEALRKDEYTEAPSESNLARFYRASPLAHVNKVKVPCLFLLGAQDRRVPISNGFQYVHALRQRDLEVKVIVFPEDIHSIDKPQSDFESFVNIGGWFKRFFSS